MSETNQEVAELKLFSQLKGYFYDSGDVYRPFSGSALWGYEEEIQKAMKENWIQKQPAGLAEYLSDPVLKGKIISLHPAVEEYLCSLWGVLVVKSREALSEKEVQALKREWYGQMTDGWGEGFAQDEIACGEGCRLYVDFGCIYNDGIRTEQELKAPLEKREAFQMGM